MALRRLKEFHYLEFRAVVGGDGSTFKAVGYDRNDSKVAEVEASTEEEAVAAIKAALNPLSNEFVGIEGAINLFLSPYYHFPKLLLNNIILM